MQSGLFILRERKINAKYRMQNAKLRYGEIEAQTVGDDGLACGLMFATRIALCND